MEEIQPKLAVREWAAVIAFVSVLVFIALLAFVINQRDPHLIPPETSSGKIFISLEGAVENPQTFKVDPGTKLSDLIDRAGMLAETDLSSIELKRALKSDQVIKVPEKQTITVFLEGNVSPKGAFTIDRGASLKDLYSEMNKEPPASNRKLENEEVIKFYP